MKEKIKVYLCARISADAHTWNDEVSNSLDKRIRVFKPQKHNPYYLNHREFQESVYETDLKAMQESDLGLLLAPYGRDCAWEVGWYSHSKKPIVAYVEKQTEWLRDWMIKGGIDKVITSQEWLYDILKKDPIVGNKCELIENRNQLSDSLTRIVAESRGDNNG